MIQKITNNILKGLILNQTITDEDKELYEYGLHQGIVILINLFTALCIGIVMNMIWQSAVLLLFFIPVRTFAGGFHANSPRICYIFSLLMQIGALRILNVISFSILINICVLVITGFLIIYLSPVEALNKPLDGFEIKKYKKISIRNWSIELIFWILFYMLGLMQVADCILMSFILVSVLLIAGAISNRIRAK